MTRIANQIPLYKTAPKYTDSYGEDCIQLASAYGLVPDEWQANYLRDMFCINKRGKPKATICGLDVPRQNGKNAILEIAELFAMCILGWNILHTAHEVKTANKAFKRLRAFFEQPDRYPELAGLVKQIRRTNGQEAIYLQRENPETGFIEDFGSIEFSARTRGSARGFSDLQLLVYDEAQELTDEQQEAMTSTMAASKTGTRMIVYTGTPPPPGSPGTVMANIRREALAGKLKGAVWHSWALDDYKKIVGDWEDVLDVVYKCNPALGTRLDEEYTYTEYKVMTPDGFARERCDWWSEAVNKELITEAQWSACATKCAPKKEDCILSFGIKFDPNGTDVSLSVCAKERNTTRPPHIELIAVKPQSLDSIRWIAQFIEDRQEKTALVLIDGRSGTGLLLNEIKTRAIPKKMVAVANTKDASNASQLLDASIKDKTVTWFDARGQRRLTNSVINSVKRPIGKNGDWCFGGDDSTPAESSALALYAQTITKRNPYRKQRIG